MRCAICDCFLYKQTSTTEASTRSPLQHIHAAASYTNDHTEIAICPVCNREPKLRNQFWAMVAGLRGRVAA